MKNSLSFCAFGKICNASGSRKCIYELNLRRWSVRMQVQRCATYVRECVCWIAHIHDLRQLFLVDVILNRVHFIPKYIDVQCSFRKHLKKVICGPHLCELQNLLNWLTVGRSGSGSSPKSNQFVRVTHTTCPPNFIRVRPQLFEISNKQEEDVVQITILEK